jgi:hypothetical protein
MSTNDESLGTRGILARAAEIRRRWSRAERVRRTGLPPDSAFRLPRSATYPSQRQLNTTLGVPHGLRNDELRNCEW